MKKNVVVIVLLMLIVVAMGVWAFRLRGLLAEAYNDLDQAGAALAAQEAALLDLSTRTDAAGDLARQETLVGIVDEACDFWVELPADCGFVWDDVQARTMFDGRLGLGQSGFSVGGVERGSEPPALHRLWAVGRKNYFNASAFSGTVDESLAPYFSTMTTVGHLPPFEGAEAIVATLAGWTAQQHPDWLIQHISPVEGGGARAILTHPLGMLVFVLMPDDDPNKGPDDYVLHHFMYMGVGADADWLDAQLTE